MMSRDKANKRLQKIQITYNRIEYKELEFCDGDDYHQGGRFGNVRRAKWKGLPVAVKSFKGDEKYAFSDELQNLNKLKHPHIVRMYGANTHSEVIGRFIVLEYAHNSLAKVLHSANHQFCYTGHHVYMWARAIAEALAFMHQKNVIHRDIKSNNMVLFGDGHHLKLIDFGTARDLSQTMEMTKSIGTLRYMAPEMLRGEQYTAKCDVFSFGIVVWEMIARLPPNIKFGDKMPWEMIYYAMAKRGARPPKIEGNHPFFERLITHCWHEEPEKRPTSDLIVKKLQAIGSYFQMNLPLQRMNSKGRRVVYDPAKVRQNKKFLGIKRAKAPRSSGGSREGTGSSVASGRTPESSLGCEFIAVQIQLQDQPRDSLLSNRGDSNVEPAPPLKPPKPKEVQPPDQEPKKEVEELPPPITVPRPDSPPSPSTPPQPPAPPVTPALPPQGIVHRAPSPDVPPVPPSPDVPPVPPSPDVPPVPPAQLLPRPVLGNLDPHQVMQPLFPHEYPRGYPATGFPPLPYQVDDMYGETLNVVHPGYVSPTGYTTTPYWTRPPEIDTQESVYEVENEHGIRDEEFRSMNIVRELFNRIGKQVSKEELPSYIVGPVASIPGGPDRERSIEVLQPKTAEPGSKYYIPDIESKFQPVIPFEESAESMQLHSMFCELLEEFRSLNSSKAQREKEIMDLNVKLEQQEKDMEQQKRKHETFQALSDKHERLLSQREKLNKEVQDLQEMVRSYEHYWQQAYH